MSNKARSDESIARCPACGAEVWIHEVSYTDGDIWFTPRCSECNVALAENYPTYEDAVAAWNETWSKKNKVSPQKDAYEIVKALKELLPEQVDYAELVGSPVPLSYGYCYVWKDPEPYIIQNGIDLIASLQDDVLRLSALNKEAMELLGLVKTICGRTDDVLILKANISVHVLDRYEALKAKGNTPTKNTDVEGGIWSYSM